MTPGEIYLVSYPNRDGTETKARPVLVAFLGPTGARNDEVVLVAQITGAPQRVRDPMIGDIVMEDNYDAFGLHRPSVIRARQVISLPPPALLERIGAVDGETLLRAQREIALLIPPDFPRD